MRMYCSRCVCVWVRTSKYKVVLLAMANVQHVYVIDEIQEVQMREREYALPTLTFNNAVN